MKRKHKSPPREILRNHVITTPPAYPPGDEPTMTSEELRSLLDEPFCSTEVLDAVLQERARVHRKLSGSWIFGRDDCEARAHSATATAMTIYELTDELMRGGLLRQNVCRANQRSAQGPRAEPFDSFLIGYVTRHQDYSIEELWRGLQEEQESTDQGELTVSFSEDAEDGREKLCWKWEPKDEYFRERQEPIPPVRRGRPLLFVSFKAKLRKLRERGEI